MGSLPSEAIPTYRPASNGRESVGCNTGTGKPAVFPKRVRQVRVRCWILTHRRTLRTRATVLRVLTGLF